MTELSLGDLAHTFLLRRQSAQLKGDLTRLTTELATGRTSDTSAHLGGRFTALAEFERDLVLLDRYATTADEVATQSSAMQLALESIQTQTGDLSETIALASAGATPNDKSLVAHEAGARLGSIISALNTSVAGRSIFSGTDTTTQPLANSGTLLADLRTAISGATSAADVLALADTFFDTPGGGFETAIYQGGQHDLQPFDLGAGESVTLALRADDQVLRDVIKNVALAALADDPGVSLDNGQSKAFLQSLAEGAFTGQDGITRLRANLGFAEERIETAATRLSAESASVEFARNQLLAVDPFQTATELESVQTQLETLYTITARSSRLSLVNFLS